MWNWVWRHEFQNHQFTAESGVVEHGYDENTYIAKKWFSC